MTQPHPVDVADVTRAPSAQPAPSVLASGGWPASPLAAVGRAFDLLAAPPTRHLIGGRTVPGLPAGPVDLGRLRQVLLAPETSRSVRDALWRELVTRARQPGPEGQAWTVLAAGMALPGLTAAAAGLTRGWRGETADIDAEVLAGFVARLATLDLEAPRVAGRLIDAGLRAGRRARAGVAVVDAVRVDQAWSAPPRQPWDHPDWVLARAVQAGVLDVTEARLIGATRLEDIALADAAAALRIDPELAADWRWRAERRLRDAIRTGELDAVRVAPPASVGARGRAAVLAAAKAERVRHHLGHPRPGDVAAAAS